VHAPAGAEQRFALMYHGIGTQAMTEEFAVHELADAQTTRVGPITVTAYRVAHPIEAYGFRVEADGAVLAYTGDTDACPNLSPLLRGADLALMDSAFVDGRDSDPGIHLSGSRAARAAVDAGGVRRLVLTHMPAWNDPATCLEQAATVWTGPLEVATSGRTWDLGAESGAPDDTAGSAA
jgi:ribonuclease BN (tRNA processing enzyme)